MIIVNLQLKPNPGTLTEFKDWFTAILPDTRNYEGCSEEEYEEVLVSLGSPNR